MSKRLIWLQLTIILLTYPHAIFAQQLKNERHHHNEHVYELGISLGLAHLKKEGDNAIGSHVHIFKRLGSGNELERIAIGFGIEYIFTEHSHMSFLGTLSFNPFAAFIIDISPGILKTEHDSEKEIKYITHLELTYEFDLNSFGLGPVVGTTFSGDDQHYMIGLHFGKGF